LAVFLANRLYIFAVVHEKKAWEALIATARALEAAFLLSTRSNAGKNNL
jgi:hypothetical protein